MENSRKQVIQCVRVRMYVYMYVGCAVKWEGGNANDMCV